MIDLTAVLTPKEGRSIERITADILEAKRVAGDATMTIGNCLMEAKAVLPHGEWLPWLNEQVEFTERTAQKIMRLAREYANTNTLSYLGAAKAYTLLAIGSKEERNAFLTEAHVVNGQEKTVIDMSTRELDRAIKERDEARKAQERAEADKRNAEESRVKMESDMALLKERYETVRAESEETTARLRKELEDLKAAPVDVAVMEADQEVIDKAKAEAVAEIQAELEKADNRRRSAEEALKDTTAKLAAMEKQVKKQAVTVDQDVASFKVFFDQTQETVNKMRGLLLKARGREDQSTALSMEKALRDLGEAIVKDLDSRNQAGSSPLNQSCITGMSPSGHCGAAATCPEPYQCCLACDKACNLRCGWCEEREEDHESTNK